MARSWRLTATVVGLIAGFAACATGEGTGPLGTSTASSTGTGGTTSTASSSSSSSGMGGMGGGTTASSASSTGGTGGSGLCGNGKIDPGESCDGTDFGSQTCASLGLGTGSLICTAGCTIDVSGCEPMENCTNDVDDNNNGLIDCQDPQCFGMPGCVDSCLPTYPATIPAGDETGDTTGRPAVHHASCSSKTSGNEQIFQVTSPSTGVMSLDLSDCFVWNASVSVRTSCESDTSEIACNSTPDPNLGDVLLNVPVVKGQTYFVMVQGMTPADFGPFELFLDLVPPETICDDLIDNDSNTFVDCDDPNCQTLAACTPGTTPTGQPCTVNTNCTANNNDPICLNTEAWPNGYCSEFCNVTTQDCSTGNLCYAGLSLSANGVCLHECTLDTDCSAGYACNDLGLSSKVCTLAPETVCDDYVDNDFDGLTDCQDPSACQTLPACTPGPNAIGQACTLHNQCSASAGTNNPLCLDEAHEFYTNGYCSHFCDPTVATDCGPDGICVANGPNGANVCMATCTTSTQCRTADGYTCQNAGFAKMICTQ